MHRCSTLAVCRHSFFFTLSLIEQHVTFSIAKQGQGQAFMTKHELFLPETVPHSRFLTSHSIITGVYKVDEECCRENCLRLEERFQAEKSTLLLVLAWTLRLSMIVARDTSINILDARITIHW